MNVKLIFVSHKQTVYIDYIELYVATPHEQTQTISKANNTVVNLFVIALKIDHLARSSPKPLAILAVHLQLFFIVVLVCHHQADANNAPNINYSHNMRILKLPRKLSSGTLVYRLKGSDPDPDVLSFSIRGRDAANLLEVKPVSFTEADVYLIGQLKDKEYNLTISVSDGQTTTEVDSTILVTDPDPLPPSPFINIPSLFKIPENATKHTSVGFVTVRDRNSSHLPARFELRGSDKFMIRYVFGPRGTSKAEILLVKPVDYETKSLYLLQILALNAWVNETYDTRNVIATDIVVVVEDIAESPPRSVGLSNVVYIGFAQEFNKIIWILLGFVVLIVFFLLILLCCWCFYRFCPDRQKLVALPEGWEKGTTGVDVEGSKRSLNANQRDPATIKRTVRADNDYYETEVRPVSPSFSGDGSEIELTRGDNSKYARIRRNRVAPVGDDITDQIISDEYGLYNSDLDERDSRNRKYRNVSRTRPRHVAAINDDEEDMAYMAAAGRYKIGRGRQRIKPKRTEILYIRSPVHAMNSVERSISEGAMRSNNETDPNDRTATPSSVETGEKSSKTVKKRQVSFRTESSENIPGSVPISDQDEVYPDKPSRYRSVSNITLASDGVVVPASEDGRRPSLKVTTPSDPATPSMPSQTNLVSSSAPMRTGTPGTREERLPSLPGSVEDFYTEKETHPKSAYGDEERTTIVDLDENLESMVNIPPPDYDTSDIPTPEPTKQPSKTALKPDSTVRKEAEKSDSDSGIGHISGVTLNNLKNSDLMQKKSIFTVAYDGVKTARIKSAESGDSV